MKKINGNQINVNYKKDQQFSEKILRRLDYLAELAFCTLENEKKIHVIHAALGH